MSNNYSSSNNNMGNANNKNARNASDKNTTNRNASDKNTTELQLLNEGKSRRRGVPKGVSPSALLFLLFFLTKYMERK